MACGQCSSFTSDGKYFGSCGPDGKLKIWDTSTGILKQEFTPNLHLTTPCACLTWIVTSRTNTPKGQKRKSRDKTHDTGGTIDVAALGTASGSILLYSIVSGREEGQLLNGHSAPVNHLTWSRGTNLFSCGDDHLIIEWNIGSKSVASKWKAGKDRLTCILVLPDGKLLLSASLSINLWDLATKQAVKTFTGHASPVVSLALAPEASSGGESYFISAARDDRLLSAWSLKLNRSKDAAASFLMEDVAASVSVMSGGGSAPTRMAAVTRSGALHYYQHVLNGKCGKPLKAKLTVLIAVDTGQNKSSQTTPIPFVHAKVTADSNILVAYGSASLIAIETICPLNHDKVLCLIRQDPRKLSMQTVEAISKVKTPETNEGVSYIVGAAVSVGVKRGAKGKLQSEVPLADRLNLALTKPDVNSKTPNKQSMVQLLIQGLHSKERKLLQSVLSNREPAIITNTVAQLPVQLISQLVEELTRLIQCKTHVSQVAALWLRCVVSTHAGQLLAMPDIGSSFSGMLGVVETRLRMLPPLTRLRGRLDLLVDQIGSGSKQAEQDVDQVLLVYQEPDSSDEDSEMDGVLMHGSETEEDQWDEQTESDEVSEVEAQPEGMESSE